MDFESLMVPPPLTPPLKGEGEGDDGGLGLPPSPLRGGIEGGGPAKPNKESVHMR